jgi:predicted RNA-binding Zn-ribbon protein involved in translation (DUF1610 family)
MGDFAMLIYGTRGLTSVVDAGQFHCPQCGAGTYKHKQVRRSSRSTLFH